jgi:D-arabinose 1-dehydrogenase-like Zn-dependent alcohol dehydrogenase
MGIGGLRHYGVLWAKAMGATVVGMSHNDKKREIANELGCDNYINTNNSEQMNKYKKKMTHILCTGAGADFKWATYLDFLRSNSHFINVNLPDWNLPDLNANYFSAELVFIHGSMIGAPHEMLKFEKNVRPWTQVYPMKEAQKAVEDFKEGKPRFRFVLEN